MVSFQYPILSMTDISALECVLVRCRVVQCVGVHCTLCQCVAGECPTTDSRNLSKSACSPRRRPKQYPSLPCALQCVAVHCSALQCVAVRCSALQCVAVRCTRGPYGTLEGSQQKCVFAAPLPEIASTAAMSPGVSAKSRAPLFVSICCALEDPKTADPLRERERERVRERDKDRMSEGGRVRERGRGGGRERERKRMRVKESKRERARKGGVKIEREGESERERERERDGTYRSICAISLFLHLHMCSLFLCFFLLTHMYVTSMCVYLYTYYINIEFFDKIAYICQSLRFREFSRKRETYM